MAARKAKGTLDKPWDEKVRLKIKTSMLLNRLSTFALSEEDPASKKPVELDMPRLKAIEILLRKALPDLSAVTVSGDPENPLVHKIERIIVRPKDTDG